MLQLVNSSAHIICISSASASSMMLLKESEKQQVKARVDNLSPALKNPIVLIVFFETLATAILAYGICISEYRHPISRNVQNPFSTFLVSCFLYLAIVVAAPFSGGHANPSITIAAIATQIQSKNRIAFFVVSQLIGAILGTFIYRIFLGNPPEIYSQIATTGQVMLDCLSQAFGTFIFAFGFIYACKRNYVSGEYFKYLFIVTMLLLGRTFTFRKACLNPAIGICLQLFASIHHCNVRIFLQAYGVVAGPLVGGFLAAVFYNKFYSRVLNSLENKDDKQGM